MLSGRNIRQPQFLILKKELMASYLDTFSNTQLAQYLRYNRNCAFILWQPVDVKLKAKELGIDITEDEVVYILDSLDSHADCNYGITWDHIESAIQNIKN